MISCYHPGMRHEVSVKDFTVVLVKRRVSAMESNARRIARCMERVIRFQLKGGADRAVMLSDGMLNGMARNYGVVKELIPYAVERVKEQFGVV